MDMNPWLAFFVVALSLALTRAASLSPLSATPASARIDRSV